VGSLHEWVHLDAIQALVHHATAVVAAIFLFAVTGRLIAFLIPDGHAKKLVIIIDDAILLSVFALAGWRLLLYMWVRPHMENNPVAQVVRAARPTLEEGSADAIDATLAQCRAEAASNGGQVEQCLQQKYDQAEHALDDAVVRMRADQRALDKVGSTKIGATNSFNAAQQAFVSYREAECKWRSTAAGGGDPADVYQACMADLSAWRAVQMDKLLEK
jgi:uncharacterized protein YecT (DUF1311 family)